MIHKNWNKNDGREEKGRERVKIRQTGCESVRIRMKVHEKREESRMGTREVYNIVIFFMVGSPAIGWLGLCFSFVSSVTFLDSAVGAASVGRWPFVFAGPPLSLFAIHMPFCPRFLLPLRV